MKQLEIHSRIDEFFKQNISTASLVTAQEFISYNDDAKRYFFSKATEMWLKWIWDNDLFATLKIKANDPTQYGYRLPELDYLTKMAGQAPGLVADIILSIPVSKETFNPEVVDRFFWITGQLPAAQIESILPKILSEKWVNLMALFNRSGYEYQKMVEKLQEAKNYNALLSLAKVVLTVRAKENFAEWDRFSISDKLFYLGDVSATGIFEALTDNDNPKKEETLQVFLDLVSEVVSLGKDREDSVFDQVEPFYLLNIDVFTLELDSGKHSHFREDIQNLIAACKILIRSTIGENCEKNPRAIYENRIAKLPDSVTCWRLKLYAITRCPLEFTAELQEAFFRVFNVGERYFEIDGGAEYHQALLAAFSALPEAVRHDYVLKVIDYYGESLSDKDKEKWRRRDGREIISFIRKDIKPEDLEKAETIFGKIPEDKPVVPHPAVGEITSGFVSHKAPFEPGSLSLSELVAHLKTDATPKALAERYKGDDFFRPRGTEGLADAIKADFLLRRSEYLANIDLFFDREIIDPVYVYPLLQGTEELIRANHPLSELESIQIINFLDLIRQSGEQKAFEKSDEKSYYIDWITVHKVAADVLLQILAVLKDGQAFKDNRDKVFSIIKYLLNVKSSPDSTDDEREADDPGMVAINSVRGQAYRTFIQFIYNDGNKTLSDDSKKLFEHVLDTDESNAVRFTLGQFFASIYFRDIDFVTALLPKVFPKDSTKRKLYYATWEGYLASSLYKELFETLNSEYEYAIKLGPKDYPDRKYSKDLDESIAAHMALAYAHFDLNTESPLFKLFWGTPSETRHYEFVSFIGRTFITRSQAGEEWFVENKVSKEKLIEFWNWALSADLAIEPHAFSAFGFWINPDKEIIDNKIVIKNISSSLERAEGEIDWEYGLTKQLEEFARIEPKETLEIIRHFLLHDGDLNKHRRVPLFSLDSEVKDALDIIYQTDSLKNDVAELIDHLIEKGGSMFWVLKPVLK